MKKNGVIIFIIIAVLGLLLIAFLFSGRRVGNKEFDTKKYIASVNNEGILRDDFQKEVTYREHFFTWAKQKNLDLSSLKKDVLERMIEDELISEQAQGDKISVSDQEVEERIGTGGKDARAKKLNQVQEMYGFTKEVYQEKVRLDILREKLQERINEPLATWLLEAKNKADIKRFL